MLTKSTRLSFQQHVHLKGWLSIKARQAEGAVVQQQWLTVPSADCLALLFTLRIALQRRKQDESVEPSPALSLSPPPPLSLSRARARATLEVLFLEKYQYTFFSFTLKIQRIMLALCVYSRYAVCF